MSVGNDGQQRQNAQDSAQRGGGKAAPGAGAASQDWGAIKDEVTEIAGTAVERGRHLLGSSLDSAKQQGIGYLDQRKDELAERVAEFGRALRNAMSEFDDRPAIRSFVDSAAGGVEQFSDAMRARSFNEIFEDVEELVRRRPAAAAGATMMVGFLIARFIKSSAEGIREAEARRRRGASKRPQARGRARAQASPGSSYVGA